MKSISSKITFRVSLNIILSLAVLSVVLVLSSSSKIIKLTLKDYESKTKFIAAKILERDLVMKSTLSTTADAILSQKNISKEIAESLLVSIFESNPDLSDLFVGFEDKTAYFGSLWEPPSDWICTERVWYKDAVANNGKFIYTDPYLDAMTNQICTTLCSTLIVDNKITGVIAMDIFYDEFIKTISEFTNTNENGISYIMLLNKNGDIYSHQNPEFCPTEEETFNLNNVAGGKYASILTQTDGNHRLMKDYNGINSYFITVPVEDSNWLLCSVVPALGVEGERIKQIAISALISICFIAICIFIVIVSIRRLVTEPIKKMVDAANSMATGDLDISLDVNTDDELGEYAKAFNNIIDATKENVMALEAIAKGDLTKSVNIRSDKDSMNKALASMIETNNEFLSNISVSSSKVSQNSDVLAQIGNSLKSSSQEQLNAVESLYASSSEMYKITKNSNELAENALTLSTLVIENAEGGRHKMNDMLEAVHQINLASQSIEKVIKVIDDIAFQTNILALNASVEAARAGIHGKGFAVVAEEVRNLAAKSAEAARNTNSLIANSIEKALLGNQLAEETSKSFADIVDGIKESSVKINEITQSSSAQFDAIEHISNDIKQVQSIVNQTTSYAVDCADSSKNLKTESDTLNQLLSTYNLK